METPSTITEATAPTGDIKIFVDAFNIEIDKELKSLLDAKANCKNTYADAIKITTPKLGEWPNDPKVVTIGDLFKFTFPDLDSPRSNAPSDSDPNYGAWKRDLKDSKDETIKQMYKTIKNGIIANSMIAEYESIKKSGVTNPSLYSPGQYYFDVFMSVILSNSGPLKNPTDGNGGDNVDYDFLKTYGGSTSVSNFDPSGEIELEKHGGSFSSYPIAFDYYEFSNIISRGYVEQSTKSRMKAITGIELDLEPDNTSAPKSFISLSTQYKNGITAELEKDPKFNKERGTAVEAGFAESWGPPGNFFGNYENILLYKAFVQAGDNYKSVVLPYRNPEPIAPVVPQEPVPTVVIPTPLESEYVFNVEKIDTFIFVSGTPSIPIELTVIPNDGTTYIFEETVDNNNYNIGDDELGEEYQEGGFAGTEEEIAQLAATALEKENLQGELPPDATGSTMTVESYDFNDPKYIGEAWKSYDINKAIDLVNKTSTKPSSKFVDSLKKVLYLIKNDPDIKDLREAAYMLGTAYAESGYSLQRWEADYACTEAGIPYGPAGPCPKATNYYRSSNGKKNYYDLGTDSKGQCYFGRGLIQLTGKGNYEKYGKLIGVNLLGNGDLAMDPINSYKVASVYMRGRTFKHVLASDLTRARKSVNGGTKGIDEVNSAYNNWVKILKDSVGTVA